MDYNRSEIISRIFPSLGTEELSELAYVSELHTYPSEQVLCQEGAFEDTFYIVVDGQVEISKQISTDTSMVLKELKSGDFFGEIALVQEWPRSATVKTTRPSILLELKRETFRRALHKNAEMAVKIMLAVTDHLRDADIRTIAKLRAKNEELAKAYAELERQEKLRSEFLTTVSHELRTPLTAAMGYTQLITSGMAPPEQAPEFAKTVEENLRTVVHLVNNILFLQELEIITPEFKSICVPDLVLESVQEKLALANQGNLVINTQLDSGLPNIMGDPDSLSRAISALLDNAIKFSPDGGEITIAVHANHHSIQVSIRDPGVGFPMERREEIFQPFTRIESVDDHLFGGLGLGLPIAEHAVTMHGGRIEAKSQEGNGSTFTIVLPVNASTK